MGRQANLKLTLSFQGTVTNVLADGQQATCSIGETVLTGKLNDGAGDSQVSRLWEDRDRALASGANEDIDLFDFVGLDIGAGDGCDALGQALTMEEIVTIIIKQESGPGRLEVKPAAVNGWTPIGTHTVATGGALRAGGLLMKHQPDASAFDVTDASNHVLNIAANGGDVTYSIYIAGRHDDDESSSSSSSSSSSTSSLSSSTSSSTSSVSSLSSSTSSSSSTS